MKPENLGRHLGAAVRVAFFETCVLALLIAIFWLGVRFLITPIYDQNCYLEQIAGVRSEFPCSRLHRWFGF